MADAYFALIDEIAGVATYRADPATGGPWSPGHQHGGPPSALLVHAAERLAARETGRDDLLALRCAAEFVGPVPVADVTTETRVVRAARTAVLIDAVLSAAGRECLHARIWLVRRADTTAIAPEPPPASGPPSDLPGLGATFPYGDSIEWRAMRGGLAEPGPGLVWARPTMQVARGSELTGLQRATLIGDSASGISSELDWSVWSFLNVDLDVHLARPVVGEWLLLDAATQLGPSGAALARATISDVLGPVGATAQTLVVEPLRR